MSIQGIDISSHQHAVLFDALAPEIQFVICKRTEGVGWTDPTFSFNWSETKRTGRVRGAYHFARPDGGIGNNPEAEADAFLDGLVLEPGDLVVLDYEVGYPDPVGWCKAWLDIVRERTGVRPFVYLNLSLVRGFDWSPVIAAGYPLWLADYDGSTDVVNAQEFGEEPLKQWTSAGHIAGVLTAVDLNVFYGSRAQLLKFGKEEAKVATTPTYAGESVTVVNYVVGDPPVMVDTFWDYGQGPRAVPFKVYATAPGMWPVLQYPPADPDADPTLVLNAQPGLFIVAARAHP